MIEDTYRQVFHDTVAPLAILDNKLRFVDVSDVYIQMMGRTRADLIGKYLFDVFPDTTHNEKILRDAWPDALNGKPSVLAQIHYPIPKTDGVQDGEMEDRWWAVHSGPVRTGEPLHKLIVFRVEDITERVRLEKARNIVTKELQHRMVNLTTLIGVIARQSARSHDDIETFISEFLDRLTALSRSSKLLVSDIWDGLDMHSLVQDTLDAFNDGGARRIFWEGPQVTLSASAAQAIAMGLHELATNASKYGALSTSDATITIKWAIASDDTLSFIWQENGPGGTAETGVVKDADRIGFGTKMLKQLLPMQMNGRAEHGIIDGGMQYRLTAPIDQFGTLGDMAPADVR